MIRKVHSKLEYVLLGIFAFFPIFPNAVQSIACGIFTFIFIYNTIKNELVNTISIYTKLYILAMAILLIVSFLNSSNVNSYSQRLLILLPLIVAIPFLKESQRFWDKKQFKLIVWFFNLGLIVYAILYLKFYIDGFTLLQYEYDQSYFIDMNLVEKIQFFMEKKTHFLSSHYGYFLSGVKTEFFTHYTYVSVLFYLGITMMIHILSMADKVLEKLVIVLVVLFLISFIYFIPSDTKYIIFALLAVSILMKIVMQKLSVKTIILIFTVIAVSILLYVMNKDLFVSNKFIDAQRLGIWNAVLEFFNFKNVIFGIGLGDIQDTLNQILPQSVYLEDYTKKRITLNTHNQYLDILLGFGMIGLLLLLGSILYFMFKLIKKVQCPVLILCGLGVFIVLGFENLLNRSWGVFIIYFYILFVRNIYLTKKAGNE